MLPHVVPRPRFFQRTSPAAILLTLVLIAPAIALGAEPDEAPLSAAEDNTPSPAAAPNSVGMVPHHEAAANLSTAAVDDTFRHRFWLVDPRARPSKPESNLMKLEIHGEYQLRYTKLTDLALSNYAFPDYRQSLGQNQRLEHRMRFTPHFAYRKSFNVVAQFDAPYGLLLGDATDHVVGSRGPISETQPMTLAFRWLFADYRFERGKITFGQQPSRWGLGLLFDSGDERQFLGDTRLGTIVERLAFVGKPFGPDTKFELLMATDWVYADAKTRWLDGDRALRAMAGLSYVESPGRRIGLLVVGERFQPHFAQPELAAVRPSETTATFDLAAQTAFPVPGQAAHIVAESEIAAVLGSSDVSPEIFASRNAKVRRFGALARIGAVGTRGSGERRWGQWGLMLEWGYASGDADPTDGVDRRFVTNPSRRVGLILFDEVMRWRSARARVVLEDARLGQRSMASSAMLPTEGGVAGATYLSLQWLYRPLPNFDLRAASLFAQTSSDLVDPARLVTSGRWSNFDGGNSAHRDLGIELDLATEWRKPLDNGLGVSVGAEGGLLLPGRALADVAERTLGSQALIRGRFGFYF